MKEDNYSETDSRRRTSTGEMNRGMGEEPLHKPMGVESLKNKEWLNRTKMRRIDKMNIGRDVR